jgi:hypothetical protein
MRLSEGGDVALNKLSVRLSTVCTVLLMVCGRGSLPSRHLTQLRQRLELALHLPASVDLSHIDHLAAT